MNKKSPAPWQPTKPLERGNAAEQIFEDLRAQILAGDLARGAKLPTEKQLGLAYGVASATAREAVRSLATARLVEVRHGSGAYVTADTDQLVAVSLHSMIQMERIGIPELLGVLGALNTYAGEVAASRATKADIAAMRQALADMDSATTADAISVALGNFLDQLARATNNPLLIALCRYLTGIQVGFAAQLSGGTLEGWRKTSRRLNKERHLLVDAIAAGDPAAARQAARTYHERSLKVITALPNAGSARVSDPVLSWLFSLDSKKLTQ